MEARVDRETFTISFGGHQTAVHRYPISIDWPPAAEFTAKPVEECRRDIRSQNGLSENHAMGFGVDRLDYTKGILERFMAVERLLELQPEWRGRFSFIQVAAPSRSSIGSYREFETEVRSMAERINGRFGGGGYLPIILKIEHHDHAAVYEYYRAADLCFVSSLHAGMNLVAKEFLSEFAGAASQLSRWALTVNPNDVEGMAEAIRSAVLMPPRERRHRMRRLRKNVKNYDIHRWVRNLLAAAPGLAPQSPDRSGTETVFTTSAAP